MQNNDKRKWKRMITQDGESSCYKCAGMQFHPQENEEQRNCERLLMPGLHSALLRWPCWLVEASQLPLSEVIKSKVQASHLSQMLLYFSRINKNQQNLNYIWNMREFSFLPYLGSKTGTFIFQLNLLKRGV